MNSLKFFSVNNSQVPDDSIIDTEKVPFMQNGLRLRSKHRKSSTENPHVEMTCAFDSFYHVVAFAIKKSERYKIYLSSADNDILKYIIQIVEKGFIDLNQDIFENRTNLLIINNLIARRTSSREKTSQKSASNNVQYRKNTILSADGNVIPIVFKAFSNVPSLKRYQSCSVCDTVQETLSIDHAFKVDLEVLIKQGFSKLPELIDHELSIRLKCVKCVASKLDVETTSKFELSQHIYFDTSTGKISKKTYSLSSIPRELKILEKEYVVSGISSYEPNHFVSYCFYNNDWFKYDDLKESPDEILDVENIKVRPHFILYILKDLIDMRSI